MRRVSAFAVMLWASVAIAQATPSDADAPQKPSKVQKAPLDVSKLPFTPDSIRLVVAYHQDEIQACYEDLLASKDKPVEGKLMTSFTIGPNGAVRDAKVLKKGTTLKDARLHDCVVSTLTMMEFPKPEDGENHPVEFPFNLKPTNKGNARP